MLEYSVQLADIGSRLDILVANLYPQFTRSSLELLFDKRMVWVNQKAAKPSYKVKGGEEIKIDETYLMREPDAIDLPIIYQDEDMLVINKPSGILTHSKGALNLEPTVASFIKNRLTDKKLSGNRAGIVHRLDRGTSGVIVTARHEQALKNLQKQFSTRKAKKTYVALVEGVLEPPEAIIDAPIDRNPRKPQTFKVIASGRLAVTMYKGLKEFKNNGRNYSLVELTPQTGRTHQLRVHLAYIGHPVVGDSIYGHAGGELMLHAAGLEITLPNGQKKRFSAAIPKRISEFIKNG